MEVKNIAKTGISSLKHLFHELDLLCAFYYSDEGLSSLHDNFDELVNEESHKSKQNVIGKRTKH